MTRASIPEVTHHTVAVNGASLHYVSAGSEGTPILLVHGFPESWWAFHKLIPLLAASHRVFAVDLRGFGDSATGSATSAAAADDLHAVIASLDVGPMHVVGQDIAGATVFRLASQHPDDVLSLTAIEMGLAGFGLEGLADVTHGGSWHIGVLAAPGIPELLLVGREREFLGQFAFPAMTAVAGSISDDDVAEFARGYSRPDGWEGAIGLYRSMLTEGEELRSLAGERPLAMPVLAIGAGGGPFTSGTMTAAAGSEVESVQLDGVGHYAAMEAPEQVAEAIMGFVGGIRQSMSWRAPVGSSARHAPPSSRRRGRRRPRRRAPRSRRRGR